MRWLRLPISAGVLVLLACDVLLLATSFLLAMLIAFEADPQVYLLHGGGFASMTLVVGFILLFLYLQDFYSGEAMTRVQLLQHLCMALGGALMAESLINYARPDLRAPLRVMVAGTVAAFVLVFAWRGLYGSRMLAVVGATRVLFVGDSPLFGEMAERIRSHPDLGLQVIGCVADGAAPCEDITRLGSMELLGEVVRAAAPDRIVVGLRERRDRMPAAELLRLRFFGYPLEEIESVYESVCGRVCARGMRPAQWLFSLDPTPARYRLLPRTLLSGALGLAAVVAALPVVLVTALAIRLAGGGPALERCPCVGRRGREFPLLRFRSLSSGWLARALRRLSLENLPQVLNVLRGEMALVGPRPHRVETAARGSEVMPYYRQRQRVQPGITGWAQIHNAPGGAEWLLELEYDLYYVRNLSAGMDLFILFHTLKRVLQRAFSALTF